ncbi:Uncharacterised protein [Vibrio cholerae]|nr:Uncharacterised protein [Vibrio cholerae]
MGTHSNGSTSLHGNVRLAHTVSSHGYWLRAREHRA